MFRYFLTGVCLAASVISIYCAIAYGRPDSELYKWGLGLAAAFFASLTGFPINDIVSYAKARLRDQLALDLLSGYANSPLPASVVTHLSQMLN